MGGDIGILALGVGMEVVVGIFLLVSWSAISVMIAGLAFLFSSLPFECLFLMLMYTSVALCEFSPHICFNSSSFFFVCKCLQLYACYYILDLTLDKMQIKGILPSNL
jgi:hypothetical protein